MSVRISQEYIPPNDPRVIRITWIDYFTSNLLVCLHRKYRLGNTDDQCTLWDLDLHLPLNARVKALLIPCSVVQRCLPDTDQVIIVIT
jgi:hypothetical protein